MGPQEEKIYKKKFKDIPQNAFLNNGNPIRHKSFFVTVDFFFSYFMSCSTNFASHLDTFRSLTFSFFYFVKFSQSIKLSHSQAIFSSHSLYIVGETSEKFLMCDIIIIIIIIIRKKINIKKYCGCLFL